MSRGLLATLLLLASPAVGAEGADEPASAEATPPEDEAAIEVIVYEEMRVQQAREQVDQDLLEAGYTEVVHKDGKVIYRNPTPFKGEVHVYDDGWMRVKRQKVQLEGREMPWAEQNSALAWAGCVVWPFLCIRPGGQTMSRRKHSANEDRIVRWVQPDMDQWGDRIADLSVKRKVDGLPAALEALWEEGTPIGGDGPVLATYAERREHLMAYWASRTDTTWGIAVREAVAAFCRGVVQHGDHPFTDAEIDAFNAGRPDQTPFSLERTPIAEVDG